MAAINRKMPRIESVVISILNDGMATDYPTLKIGSWIENIDKRTYPLLNVRRLGGLPEDPETFDKPVIELTALSRDGLVPTEELLLDARTVIWRAVKKQQVTTDGYLHSYFETMGPTQFDSLFDDTWRVQMLVQLGLRPRRN